MLNESSIRGVMRIKNINDTSSTPVFGNEVLTKESTPYECEKICEVLTEPQEIDFHLTTALDIKEDSSLDQSIPHPLDTVDLDDLCQK
jgi:hypothetical protein